MRLLRRLAGLAPLLLAAACVTTPPAPGSGPGPGPGPSGPPPRPVGPAPPPPLDAASPAALPGWGQEDHLAAFHAYLAGCRVLREPAAEAACDRARRMASDRLTPSDARAFFEAHFSVVAVSTDDGSPGLLTAYFAPEYPARRSPDAEFDAPVLSRPTDMVRVGQTFMQRRPDGSTAPYPDRAAIEAGSAASSALAWMRAEDLFFLQIQGSGTLTFPDGARMRAAYAADNGHRFVGIARPMADQGLLPRNGTSGDAIRAWLSSNRGPRARAVTDLNPRYIFFTLNPDDGGEAVGAANVPLPARRAVAVDPSRWRYGELAWIEADGGNLPGAKASYSGLVMTLDTGSAIRGPVRADLYMGKGDAAGAEAGSVRHPLRMWRLVPRG